MKKRIFALLLIVSMLLSVATGWIERDQVDPETIAAPETAASEEAAEPEEPAEPEQQLYTVEELGYDRETLTVSSFTPLTGCFFTNMWGTGTTDADVKKLLHGYPLAQFDMSAQNYAINELVVSGYQITVDKAGNKEYNIFLNEDLFYSDGTQITAYDYAFTILMMLHPETGKAGADRPNLDYIIGAYDYAAGKSKVLSGVRVLSNNHLQIAIGANAFPYFYELSYIAFNPYPISVIAPKAKVKDDGKGVYLQGTYDAKTLKQTVLDSKKGYLTFPKVVSGPYMLKSFDGKTAEFTLNEYYKGSEEARFKTVIYNTVTSATAADTLKNGETAIVHKAMNSEAIVPLTQLMTEGVFDMSAYPRSGLSFISFCCERRPMKDKQVRQAIAMCLDKEGLAQSMVGNYGTVVDGYYGIGQWMYRLVSGAEEYPAANATELGKWQELSFDKVKTYPFDPVEAGKLLQDAGWKKNKDGIRQKKVSGKNTPLSLTLVVAEGSAAVDFFKNDFTEALKQAGIKLTVKTMSWNELLKLYYREKERSCDMFYLASNFEADFNPSSWFSPEDSAQGVANKTGIRDEYLYTFAKSLVKTDPKDTLGYCTKWVKFLESMSDAMPVIPVYSNIYFDYYTAALTGYNPSEHLSWADGVLEMSFDDVIK